jgi:two-component system sensor histidine kinase YesM
LNILIVDDEIPAVQGILKILDWRALGIRNTYTAYSMQEAQEQFQSHDIELLLTDIEMRGGTGFDLIEWASAKGLRYVGIILSSFPNFHYAQRAITLGVFEYLLKPVEDLQLEATLRRAIEHVRERRNLSNPPVQPQVNPLIARAKAYIEEHIAQDISRADIAAFVGLDPEYLSTIFRRETGSTISDFIKTERICFATRLLQQTNLPISIISENVGFESLSYFSLVFRQAVGCTPREYRKRLDEGMHSQRMYPSAEKVTVPDSPRG